MTIFDIMIISAVCYTAFVFHKRWQAILHFQALGLGIIAMFYLMDLFTMFILPLFMPMMQAMEIMQKLHLDILWVVMVAGVSFLVMGVLQLVYKVFPEHLSVLARFESTQQHLTHLASTDPLTGLANRRMFIEEVGQAINHPDSSRNGAAFLFLDLDGFKPINDTAGHDVGDAILCTVAKRIESVIRRSDFAARYGGDEFVICLRGVVDREVIERIAEQLSLSISEPMQVNNETFSTGASIGISQYPEHGNDLSTLLEKADAAMYSAKRSGGQRIAFYKKELTASGASRVG
ncbi:MAG: GGDEF domain-containing protein [Gammaproteobacteria bacterium]|nr:GGDEF domain-containing protein [Gammaproteobacteria bacterium]